MCCYPCQSKQARDGGLWQSYFFCRAFIDTVWCCGSYGSRPHHYKTRPSPANAVKKDVAVF